MVKFTGGPEISDDDLDFLSQFEDLEETPGVSLKEFDEQIDKVAEFLGVDRSEVLSMSTADLEQAIKEPDKDEAQLTLEDDDKSSPENSDETKKQNEAALDSISAKQETKVDRLVTDRYTLGDILGVPKGSTLIAVFSGNIKDNENSTRFSFVVKYPDGSLHNADMLEQDRGIHSDLEEYQVNRDGSRVEKKSPQSSYKINSPLVKNGVLTAEIGSYRHRRSWIWSKRPYNI